MENVLQDLRYGVRMLLRAPTVTIAAILALALGIGGTTAMFSAVNTVLLRPLPYPEPDRLVFISETVRRETVERRAASYPDFEGWLSRSQSFATMAITDDRSFALTGSGEAERVSGEGVSASYLPMLGASTAAGRLFLDEEDRIPGTRVAVLSYGLWQRRFAGQRSLVGSSIQLDGQSYTVVGVLKQSFHGIRNETDLWVPFTLAGKEDLQMRGRRGYDVYGRLNAGVTLDSAQAELDAIATDLEREFPDTNKDRGVELSPLSKELVGDLRQPLLVLLGAVVLVLLIACSNVANLQLARAAARQREVAIRSALGAGRLRLIRQFLTEGVLLGLFGGVFGAFLSIWSLELLKRFAPVSLPAFVKLQIDGIALSFTFGLSVLTGLAFGLVPALAGSRQDLQATLKDGVRGASAGPREGILRRGLVVAELALALVLLIGAGLLVQTFWHLRAFDPGFRPERLLTMRIGLPEQKYAREQVTGFQTQLLDRIAALPAVRSVALGSDAPLDGNSSAMMVAIEGRPHQSKDDDIRVYSHRVSPHFFGTAGATLLKGRDFTRDDTDHGQPDGVMIISQAMARRYWADGQAVGSWLIVGKDRFEIVGISGDIKFRNLVREENQDPDVYFALFQLPRRDVSLLIRTANEPGSVVASVREELRRLDPDVPLFEVATAEELVSGQTQAFRFNAVLLAAFAAVALILAVVGIYGVISYGVSLRTQELGIRIALGATKSDVLRLVVGQGLALAVLGLGLGLLGGLGAGRALAGLLYGIQPTDPVTYLVLALVLASVAVLASYVPARRASTIDPILALRYE